MSYILVRQESPVLFIGQAPAGRDDPASPLSGATGRKLAALMGMSIEEFLATFDRANLLRKYPGKLLNSKGDAFPIQKATINAFKLMRNNPPDNYRAIILLGKNVAKAFNWQNPEFLEWDRTRRPFRVVIPHPSGINHWWNDKRNQRAAKEFLTEMYESYYGVRS